MVLAHKKKADVNLLGVRESHRRCAYLVALPLHADRTPRCGGDINSISALRCNLGGAYRDRGRFDPGTAISGNAYDQDLPQLAEDWQTAVDLFENDPPIARI
jgi:hypothetical protein